MCAFAALAQHLLHFEVGGRRCRDELELEPGLAQGWEFQVWGPELPEGGQGLLCSGLFAQVFVVLVHKIGHS